MPHLASCDLLQVRLSPRHPCKMGILYRWGWTVAGSGQAGVETDVARQLVITVRYTSVPSASTLQIS